jgi:hypothetical protein
MECAGKRLKLIFPGAVRTFPFFPPSPKEDNTTNPRAALNAKLHTFRISMSAHPIPLFKPPKFANVTKLEHDIIYLFDARDSGWDPGFLEGQG